MNRQAVFFDFDGTLVDTAHGISRIFSAILKDRGRQESDVDQIRAWVSLGAGELVKRALGPALRSEVEDLALFRSELARRPPLPQDVYPGVLDLLQRLTDMGVLLAIVTNKPEHLAVQQAEALGIAAYFQVILGGDTLEVHKPDPETLFEAGRRLGVAHGVGLVGDSRVDCLTARAAGTPFVLFEGGYDAEGCSEALVAMRFGAYSAALAEKILTL